ncbi:MAG: DUF87 domain-containing protein [Bacillota bacterium]
MLRLRKPRQKGPPGREQPSIFKGAADWKDVLAPSVVKEVGPGIPSPKGKASEYWVEIGGTQEAARYFRCFYAAITSGTTYAGMLNSLYSGDFGEADCDTALHVVPADPARTVWELEHKIAQLEADYAEEKNSARKQVILHQIEELRRRHAAIRIGDQKLFFVSVQTAVSSINFDAFRRCCNLLVKRFAGKGIHLRAADVRQLQALFEMTPLDAKTVKDAFRDMESSNVADLLPFGVGGLRHRAGIVLGVDPSGGLVLYDSWHPAMGNYNVVVFGRSGFGKSFLIKLMTARSAPLGVRTAIIDPEREYENLMAGLGCPYVRLHPSSKDRVNIFDVDLVEEDDGTVRVDLDNAVQAVQAVVFRMIRIYDPGILTGQVKVLIQEKIKELYTTRRGITEDPQSLYEASWDGSAIRVAGKLKKMPTLSELHDLMEQEPELEKAAQLLKPFTKKGGVAAQAIFDCESTFDARDLPAFAFSVAGLDEEIMKPLGLFVATKWAWEKFGRDKKVKKRIVVDEAQTMMDTPETAKWLEDCFRRSRKRNISMCAGTQGFEVFLRAPQGLGILKNSSTKFLMRQEAVDIQAVREKFNLSEGEANFLLSAQRGWGIVKADNDATIFYGKTTDEEYRWFTSDPNDLRRLGGVGDAL